MILSLLLSTVIVTNNICYGTAKGYWTSLTVPGQDMKKALRKGLPKSFSKRELELTLDLYQPEDETEKRPLTVFIHGGSFYFGSKDEETYQDLCNHFASLGYVAASINYRLGFHLNRKSFSKAADDALHDVRKAIEFLAANADEYRIDKDRIFVVGSSSGAITALRLAYEGRDDASDYKIRAIANLWGAVSDTGIMDGGKASVISFHGDSDSIVPYGEGRPMADMKFASILWPGVLYGSACIDAKADEIGLRHVLYTFPGSGHALNKDKEGHINDNHEFIKGRIAEFFSEEN